jgi:hypothetical protein
LTGESPMPTMEKHDPGAGSPDQILASAIIWPS